LSICCERSPQLTSGSSPDRARGRFGEVDVDSIGRDAFIRNKKATGRTKDLGDIEDLG
jgi:hypothetical protein